MVHTTLSDDMQAASNRVQESAEKLKRHIQASGLRPGDRYITAADAGQLLGESITTAQRAMALLAQARILERRPRAGTFIGAAVRARDPMSCVHFLLPEQFINEPGAQRDMWSQIEGMRQVLPNLSVQFNFVPNQDVSFARQVIARAGESLTGVVLIVASRAMRAYFNQSGVPTVVLGGVEPDLTNLCWLNWDQVQTGRLLADYLLGRGHSRMATIMRDVWSVGEHQIHDGIGEALAERGQAANALLVRSAPVERVAICGLARSLLLEANPPTAFVCRTEFQADCVTEVSREVGKTDVDVVVCNAPVASDRLRYTCAVAELSILEMGNIIGEMIRDMTQGKAPSPRGRRLPVCLHRVEK